jgi:hypothetical protein
MFMRTWSLITWNIWLSWVIGLIILIVLILGDHMTFWHSAFLGVCVLICSVVALWALLRSGVREWRAPDCRLQQFLGFDGGTTRRHVASNWVLMVLAGVIVLLVTVTLLHPPKVVTNVPVQAPPAGALSTDQAKNHIGTTSTVCGIVMSKHYGGGGLTYIYLDKEWPHEEFSIGIWAENWTKFSPPPSSWIGKQVCVTGLIKRYHGVPNIMAESQAQISVK